MTQDSSSPLFRPVPGNPSFPEMELQTLRWWQEKRIFERSLEQTQDGPRYTFYEGPPTANGVPGIHHVEARSLKDLGIAGVTAAVLASNGAAWGLATGVILCLVVYGRDFFRGEPDATFEAMLRAQEGQAAES